MFKCLEVFKIIAHPVPIDLNILKALKRPPRGFHLYLWLTTYRTGRGRALGRHRAPE